VEMDPWAGCPRGGGWGWDRADDRGRAGVARGARERRAAAGWGLPPQVAADERQRVDELDEPVREHDQQRRRMLEAVAQFLEQPGLVEVDAHPAAVLDRLFA